MVDPGSDMILWTFQLPMLTYLSLAVDIYCICFAPGLIEDGCLK